MPTPSPKNSSSAEISPMDRSYVPPKDEVAKRAYFIFLNRGGYNGADLDHWLEAELQLFAEHNAALKKDQPKL